MEAQSREHARDASQRPTRSTPPREWVLRLGGLTPWELVKRVAKDSRRDDALGWAAQLSFYFILAFFPLMIFACSAAGSFVADQDRLAHAILDYMRPILPEAGFQLFRTTLDQVLNTRHIRLGSFLFSLWSASYGFEALINGLNVAFDIDEYRSWWARRLLAIGLTAAFAGAIVGVLAILVGGGEIGGSLAAKVGGGGAFDGVWPVLRWTLVVAVFFCVVTGIYKFAPNLRRQPVVSVLPGTLVAILLWIGASILFRAYVGRFFSTAFANVYGSLGAVIAMMLWLYITGAALLVGAEVNSEIRWAASDAGHATARDALQMKRR